MLMLSGDKLKSPKAIGRSATQEIPSTVETQRFIITYTGAYMPSIFSDPIEHPL